MLLGQADNQRLLGQRERRRVRRRLAQQRYVDAPLVQRAALGDHIEFPHLDMHVGPDSGEALKRLDEEREAFQEHAHDELFVVAACVPSGCRDGPVGRRHASVRLDQELAAGGGQLDPARVPVQQLDAQLALQLAQRLRQRRLGEV
jgi:hypothetical protein